MGHFLSLELQAPQITMTEWRRQHEWQMKKADFSVTASQLDGRPGPPRRGGLVSLELDASALKSMLCAGLV
jgi:hypothetical protein